LTTTQREIDIATFGCASSTMVVLLLVMHLLILLIFWFVYYDRRQRFTGAKVCVGQSRGMHTEGMKSMRERSLGFG
jgi:hypothetical protein